MTVKAILSRKGGDVVHDRANRKPDRRSQAARRAPHRRCSSSPVRTIAWRASSPSAISCARVAERGHAALEENVGAVMTRKVTTCTETDTIAVIMERMTEGKFRHMPVVDQGKLVGVISIGDVVKWRVGEIEGESAALREYIATA